MKTFQPIAPYIKTIGRTYHFNGALWLALSGAGVEFLLAGDKAEIILKGDNVVSTGGNYARIGIEVNGKRIIDDVLVEPVKTYTVLNSHTDQDVVVRVVKLSEAAMSTVGIQEIRVDEQGEIKPTPSNAHKIEFIGDSITAGYGIDDENPEHHFSTATEDVTKAFAYKTAEALQADYSIVAYSGYGVISGYTSDGQRQSSQLVPTYYDKVGFSYGHFDSSLDVASLDWDFTNFVPDLIVVNLGTNDDSYTGDDKAKQEEFSRMYVEFLKQVRSYNTKAKFLCTLGIMGDRLYPYLERAVADYTAQTGDSNVSTMKFDVQSSADGYTADWHPTEATQAKAATKLIEVIKERMQW